MIDVEQGDSFLLPLGPPNADLHVLLEPNR